MSVISPCEDGCNVPLYTPPEEPAAPASDDNFGGRAAARSPILGDSSDKQVTRPHRNASWPAEKLIEYVRQRPFCTLAPGEAWHIIEHFEREIDSLNQSLAAAQEGLDRYRNEYG